MADTIEAPFTDPQVKALNRFQFSEVMHPFTCPQQGKPLRNDHQPDEAVHGQVVLIATNDGWVCPVRGCTYTQKWAHKFMAQTGWLDQMLSYLKNPTRHPDADGVDP